MRGSNVAPSFTSSSCFISLVLPMPNVPETVSHPLNAWTARISLIVRAGAVFDNVTTVVLVEERNMWILHVHVSVECEWLWSRCSRMTIRSVSSPHRRTDFPRRASVNAVWAIIPSASVLHRTTSIPVSAKASPKKPINADLLSGWDRKTGCWVVTGVFQSRSIWRSRIGDLNGP